MKNRVRFTFSARVPECHEDDRRISCVIEDYPHKPSKGDDATLPLSIPSRPNNVCYGEIIKVAHSPMGCYFTESGCEISCYVICDLEEFNHNYSEISEYLKES